MEAHERKDFEAFHDLAWAAYGKGRKNDPELMLLVARAQSLSGRPGDALVMLERIVAIGGGTDAATSDDFARVRALPRWAEVADKLGPAPAPAAKAATPAKDPGATAKAPKSAAKERPKETTPPPKEPESPPKELASPPKESASPPKEPASPAPAPSPPAKGSARMPNAALRFTTMLTPSAVVYDAVSKRFIIADRQARRIAVIDERTGQVATLVGAQGGLGDIGGIAIDPGQGDLWVVTATETGTVLHRMQLISGRVLSTVPLDAIDEPVVAMAFAHGSLVVGDSTGTVWRVRAGGRTDKLAALEYVPRAFAADPAGRLYVAAGAPRLARFALGASLRKLDTIDVDSSIPTDAPFVVAGKRLHFIVPIEGSFEIRSFAVR